MSFFKMARPDKADALFSRYIRLRDGKCVKCWKVGTGKEGISGLTCSHFWSRRYESTRFDPLNADTLCVKCHMDWEHEKMDNKGTLREYGVWKRGQLGQRNFDLLNMLAHSHRKKDRKMSLLYVQSLFREMERAQPVLGAKA